MVERPIFVIGCGRSGTTLLFNLLSNHPDVAETTGYPDGEDHIGWVKHGDCVMAGVGNVNSPMYEGGINGFHYCLHMTERDVTPEIKASMHDYYWHDVLKKNQTKRALNKTSHLSNKIGYLLEIFPDAKVVHIVRDCKAVVASWLAVMEDHPSLVVYWPEEKYPCLWLMPRPTSATAARLLATNERFYPGGSGKLFIEYWKSINLGIGEQFLGRESQLLRVKYEDLITSPSETLSEINNFCELEPYEYSVDHLLGNTSEKFRHLISSDLDTAIAEAVAEANKQLGY